MTLKELKLRFLQELEDVHSPEETTSFFFLLTEHFMGKKRIDVALDPELIIESATIVLFEKALEQLKNEYPVQYITGRTDFMGLTFEVNPDVLIPRPETEELVSWVLSFHAEKHALDILEIGSGSGCIPVSLSKHLQNARIRSMDLSDKALSVAKANAKSHGVSIDFQQRDQLLSHILIDLKKKFPPGPQTRSSQSPNLFIKQQGVFIFYVKGHFWFMTEHIAMHLFLFTFSYIGRI